MSYVEPQATSVTSGDTAHTAGFSLAAEIRNLSGVQCTMDDTKGCFMSIAQLQALESRLASLMEGSIPTSMSPTALIGLHDQLNQMVSRAERAEAHAKASDEKLKAIQGSLETTSKALDAQKKASALAKASLDQEKTDLAKRLKQAEAERKQHQRHPSGVDPDDAAKLVANITELQSSLAAINASYKAETAKVARLKSQLDEAVAEQNAQRLAKERALKATISKGQKPEEAEMLHVEPYTFNEKEDPAILRKVLSRESLDILTKAAKDRQESTRQYAYTLLDYAQHTDPRNFIGYRDFLRVVTKKIKATSDRNRKKFRPFLDKVRDSALFKNAPTIKDLKAEWAELCGDPILIEKTRTEVEESEDFTFWQAVKHDFCVWAYTGSARARALTEGWWPSFKKMFSFKLPSLRFWEWWVVKTE
jgi:chemotaxis protein histidine kinase CheA